jgi:hypothetical protein
MEYNKKWVFTSMLLLISFIIFGMVYKVPYAVAVEKKVQVPYEIKEPYVVSVAYEADEPYEVKVPYYVQEPYLEKEPYQYNELLSSRVVETQLHECSTLLNYMLCLDLLVVNTDTDGGTFTADCTFQSPNRSLSDIDTGYIAPGETKILTCVADVDAGESVDPNFVVTPDTKTVTGIRTVTKNRTVTEFRTVTKYRTVTKFRNETRYRTVKIFKLETEKVRETRFRSLLEAWEML